MFALLIDRHHWTPEQIGRMTLPQAAIALCGRPDAAGVGTVKMTPEELAAFRARRQREEAC